MRLDCVPLARHVAVLRAGGGRVQAQSRDPHHLDRIVRISDGRHPVHPEPVQDADGLFKHPPERDVGQPGLGLVVAAVDIRVVAGDDRVEVSMKWGSTFDSPPPSG